MPMWVREKTFIWTFFDEEFFLACVYFWITEGLLITSHARNNLQNGHEIYNQNLLISNWLCFVGDICTTIRMYLMKWNQCNMVLWFKVCFISNKIAFSYINDIYILDNVYYNKRIFFILIYFNNNLHFNIFIIVTCWKTDIPLHLCLQKMDFARTQIRAK